MDYGKIFIVVLVAAIIFLIGAGITAVICWLAGSSPLWFIRLSVAGGITAIGIVIAIMYGTTRKK